MVYAPRRAHAHGFALVVGEDEVMEGIEGKCDVFEARIGWNSGVGPVIPMMAILWCSLSYRRKHSTSFWYLMVAPKNVF